MKTREESSPDDNEKHKCEGARKCCGISPLIEGLMVHKPQNTFHIQSLLEKESRCFENVAIVDSVENHDYFARLLQALGNFFLSS